MSDPIKPPLGVSKAGAGLAVLAGSAFFLAWLADSPDPWGYAIIVAVRFILGGLAVGLLLHRTALGLAIGAGGFVLWLLVALGLSM